MMKKLIFAFSCLMIMTMLYSAQVHAAEGEYQKPTSATNINNYYGYHGDQFYAGVSWDVYSTATKHRDQVYAPMDGKVLTVSNNEALGQFIVIEHTAELKTLLSGFETIDVQKDQLIKQGSVLGRTVTDQPLYHEVTFLGTPIDPASVIGFTSDDIQYFYTEAVDEIERGPYMLITDIDFDQWDKSTQESYAQAAEASAAIEDGTAVYCNPESSGSERCCRITGFVERGDLPEYSGLVPTAACDCNILDEQLTSDIRRQSIIERSYRSARQNQAPASILELMCWEQWAELESKVDGMYQPPSLQALLGQVFSNIAYSVSDLVNQTALPAKDAWVRGYYGQGSSVNILDLPSLAVLSYMRVQEFLDRTVDIINDGIRQLAGALLNSITGGIFTGFLGISNELYCDTMHRLWNVAEDCYDLKMPEIPDLLGRIKLPGIACELEAFAYGGKGILGAANLIAEYSPRGDKFIPYEGFYLLGQKYETGVQNELRRIRSGGN